MAEVHPDDPSKHAEHLAAMALAPPEEATISAVQSGPWSTAETWFEGRIPIAGDKVLVGEGKSVTYDVASDVSIRTVRVDGTLAFSPDVSTRLVVDTVVLSPTGVLTIGTVESPVAADVVALIEFADNGPIDVVYDPFKLSRGIVSHGAIEICGATKTPYAALDTHPVVGATSLILKQRPTGWRIGDTLVLGGTHFDESGNNADHTRFQSEILEITGIDGSVVTFVNRTNPASDGQTSLIWTHAAPEGYGLDVYVANYTRNVRLATQNHATVPIAQRGHIMFMHNPDVAVRNAEFYQLGRTDKTRLVTDPVVVDGVLVSGGENPRARYALHFHRTGVGVLGGAAAQVSGNAVFGTPGWGYVNHDSHVDMADNVAFGAVGTSFATENGNELGSFRRNLSIESTGDADPRLQFETPDRISRFDFGYNGEAFWIQGSPGVSMEDNIAISAQGGGVEIFSRVDNMRSVNFPVANIADPVLRAELQAAGLPEKVEASQLPMPQLDGMIVYNSLFGIVSWGMMRTENGDGVFQLERPFEMAHNGRTLIQGFKVWHIYGGGVYNQYGAQVTFRDGLILGFPGNPAPFVGPAFTGGNLSVINGDRQSVGVDANINTKTMRYENLHVEGFDRAFRTTSDMGGPYETSHLEGGYYAGNRYLFMSHDMERPHPFSTNFEVSGNPTFVPWPGTVNAPPVASFTTAPTVGLGVSFDGRASNDTDPPAELGISGNGIVSYHWDFGDGSEAYGDKVYHAYAEPGDYTVTLTVLDCQGAYASTSQTITVADAPDANPIINADFSDPTKFSITAHHDCRSRGLGWVGFHWNNAGGYALADRSGNAGSLIQVIRDQWTRRGAHTLSLDIKNTESAGVMPNVVKAMVYGVDGRFAINPRSDAGPGPLVAIPTQSTTLLQTDSLGGRPFDWKTFSWDLDLGQGYEYLVIRVWTQNEPESGDVVAVRDVSLLRGVTGIMRVDDAGFERVALGYGNFQYKPTGSAWTFGGGTGISADGSPFTAGNPFSSQVAFIQGTGKFSQSIPGWTAGTYTLSFLAAQRANSGVSSQDFRVLVDGVEVGTFEPSGASYEPMITEPFPVTAGTHSVEFRGLNTAGGDNTAFVDEVQITMVSLPPIVAPDVPDAGFEDVAVGAGQFRYAPPGSPWTFTGGSGISGNNSPFTSGNPPAPEGSQVAFMQDTGAISQAIDFMAGDFKVTFKAAQRNYNQIGQDFRVLVDGQVVGTFMPSGTSYQDYETAAFAVTAGSHTVEFRGINTAGGDNTAFLDAVEIAPVP